MQKTIIIGSRGSDLALWQANFVKQQLAEINIPSLIEIITTKGDISHHLSFDKIEGKGFFTKELEDALLNKSVDLAVHSLKDLPTESPEGLTIGALSYREDPSELLLIKKEAFDPTSILSLKKGATVGTSSARRKSMLVCLQDNLAIKDLRGNVPTRINKLKDGQYDAILLAAAGVNRLKIDLSDLISIPLNPKFFVPAPGQGVLGLQCRSNDVFVLEILKKMHHQDVAETVGLEREILNKFEGGCHMPVGVFATKNRGNIDLFVRKSKDADSTPIFINKYDFSTENVSQLINTCNNPPKISVFISREIERVTLFKKVIEAHEGSVLAHSCISYILKNEVELPKFDRIFFSSPSTVNAFFEINSSVDRNKLVCDAIGTGTAYVLKKLGITPEFIGSDSDIEKVGNDYLQLLNNQTVLFPIGNNSHRTVQQIIENHVNIIEIEVLTKTSRPNLEKISADVFVFTSSSNINAYAQQHTLSQKATYIVPGAKTASTLRSYGVENVIIAKNPDESELLGLVYGSFL